KDDEAERPGDPRDRFYVAALPPLGRERAKRDHQRRRRDHADDEPDRDHANDHRLKLRFHAPDTNTMPFDAAIFDFDETMIDLEAQHTFASSSLATDIGADYMQMPESSRHRSGFRVIDDVADMREFFGWTQSLDELLAIRQRHFERACRDADLTL